MKDVFHVPDLQNSVVSAGWDGFIKFWDCRSNQPICSNNIGQKIFSMSVSANLLVAALSTHQIITVNLEDVLKTGQINPCLTVSSPLKY